MSSIVFKNKGVIDPRAITTFGVSSKEGDNPIGFFGTGLKYAIAILLREDCEITIYSGLKKLEFGVKRAKIRVDSFDVITMNKKPLGFTTELGKTWELWQAIRELYCNCTDESGDIFRTTNPDIQPSKGYTTIIISGARAHQVMENIGEYILQSKPLYVTDKLEIHPGTSHFVFYKGVRVHKLPKPSLYTYNIIDRHLDLTEDRTLKYYWYAGLYIAASIISSLRFFPDILTASKDCFEHDLDFSDCSGVSDEFLSGVAQLAAARHLNLNKTAVSVLKQHRPEAVPEPEPAKLSDLEHKRIEKAIQFLHSIGVHADEYPVVVTEFLGEGILGQAKNKTIYISRLPLNMGTKCLAGTIMEEYFHLKYKYKDCNYEFQNFLIDMIITVGEQLTGDPL